MSAPATIRAATAVIDAISKLADIEKAGEHVQDSELQMNQLFADLMKTYGDKVLLVTGVHETARQYKTVHVAATRVVLSVSETAKQLREWLPVFRDLMRRGKTEAARKVLGKLSCEFKIAVDQVSEYAEKHDKVRSRVEEYVNKATELEKSAEWKSHAVDNTALVVGGSWLVSGAAAPIAFFMGGPAGTLALGSTTSFVTMCGACWISDHYLDLAKDFEKIRNVLKKIHAAVTQQVGALNEIQERLERTLKTADFLAEIAEDPELIELLDHTIEEVNERFGNLRRSCATFLETAMPPQLGLGQLEC